jgi:hypothetical protein
MKHWLHGETKIGKQLVYQGIGRLGCETVAPTWCHIPQNSNLINRGSDQIAWTVTVRHDEYPALLWSIQPVLSDMVCQKLSRTSLNKTH